jgi:hypothetical protein
VAVIRRISRGISSFIESTCGQSHRGIQSKRCFPPQEKERGKQEHYYYNIEREENLYGNPLEKGALKKDKKD